MNRCRIAPVGGRNDDALAQMGKVTRANQYVGARRPATSARFCTHVIVDQLAERHDAMQYKLL